MIVINIIQILEGHLAYKFCTTSKDSNIKLLNVNSNKEGKRKKGSDNYR